MAELISLMGQDAFTVTLRDEDDMRTHNRARTVVRVPQDATATIIRATIVDEDGTAIDLSSATGSSYFHASTQDGTNVRYQGAASYTTDGTDGQVEYALTATEVGTVRKLRCEFEVQGYGGGNLISEMFYIKVIERAAVSP